MNKSEKILLQMFKEWSGTDANTIKPFASAGSDRKYFRISSEKINCLGVYSPNEVETKAFLSFTDTFRKINLPVPEIYFVGKDINYYLIQDFGDTSLLDFHLSMAKNRIPHNDTIKYYKNAISDLAKFQIEGFKSIDFSLSYPHETFDGNSVKFDLYYFKYYFLKYFDIQYDENLLEKDFDKITKKIAANDTNYFMYRDFQARNIMIYNNKTHYIDYQGGRKGPLLYDLVSLIFQAKAYLPNDIRKELFNFYLKEIEKRIKINRKQFEEDFYYFALIRILQTLGAYGYRGYIQKKSHFLQSIPFAIENLKEFLQLKDFSKTTPELTKALNNLLNKCAKLIKPKKTEKLVLEINSFSFKNNNPVDYSGNGGGYIFDCRSLPNPGRLEQYKSLTGRDAEVIDFFKIYPEVETYFQEVLNIIKNHVNVYLDRNFTNLQINFGCTGGQHRSVYLAEKTANFFRKNKNIVVQLNHQELNL